MDYKFIIWISAKVGCSPMHDLLGMTHEKCDNCPQFMTTEMALAGKEN